jgi:4-amino-4-deoxy-L-arabinose transferase-like glycosyltransferase
MHADQSNTTQREQRWILLLIGLAVFVNFSGLFVTLIEPDAGIYASVAKNMVLRNNYWELIFQGKDWLDKPHFPFWITAASFNIFGINTWAYKLPGILFLLLGAWYTYRFALLHYSKTVALWAAFILLTAEHILISNNDVRAEPYLTGLIIAALFHFSKAVSQKLGWHLVAACFFTGCAIMTKGPFSILIIGAAVGGHLLVTKNWKALLHWKWLVAAALIVVFISPELYSLWYQFDSHPEKIVHGKTGVSGIRFFLWEGQMSRIADTGMLREKKDHFFYLHTLLWAFLPWSLVLFAAIVQKIKSGFKKTAGPTEWYTLLGTVLTVLLFSISRFQLPYYTNIVFPLMAIVTASYIPTIQKKAASFFRISQTVFTILLIAVPVLLQVLYTPIFSSYLPWIILTAILVLIIFLPRWVQQDNTLTAFCRAGIAVLFLNFYFNQLFYPDLLKYQASSEAAFIANTRYPGQPAVYVSLYTPAFEFYSQGELIQGGTNPVPPSGPSRSGTWYINEEELAQLKSNGTKYELVKELSHFNVSQLSLKFINKKTRGSQLIKRYLVRIL